MKTLLSLIVALVLLVNSACATTTFNVHLAPKLKSAGWTKPQFKDWVKAGFRKYAQAADVKFTFVDDPSLAQVLVVNGTSNNYANGVITLADTGFTAGLAIQAQVMHLFGHHLGFPDVEDIYCAMGPVPYYEFCEDERHKLVLMFGESKKHDKP